MSKNLIVKIKKYHEIQISDLNWPTLPSGVKLDLMKNLRLDNVSILGNIDKYRIINECARKNFDNLRC